MDSVILAAHNLTRTVISNNEPRTIIDNFSFEFKQGASYLVIGPSGAGKSSLLRLFNRLDEPSSGSIRFKGKDQCDYSPCELRRSIGFLFQTPYLFDGTVADNIRYAEPETSNEEIIRLSKLVQLKESMLKTDCSRFSGGEKQRVALARLLVSEPDLILLDEPTSALDPAYTEAVEQLIIKVREKFEVTIIMVSHNPEQARRIGGEALLMVEGKLTEFGDVNQVTLEPKSEAGKMYRDRRLT